MGDENTENRGLNSKKKIELGNKQNYITKRKYPLSGPPSCVMASTKRSWRSEVQRSRCFPLPPEPEPDPEGVGFLTEESLTTPTLASCSEV